MNNWLCSKLRQLDARVASRVNARSGAALDTRLAAARLSREVSRSPRASTTTSGGMTPLDGFEIYGAPDWWDELLPNQWTPIGNLGVKHCVYDLEFTYEKDDYTRLNAIMAIRLPNGRQHEIAVQGMSLDEKILRKNLWERVYFYERYYEIKGSTLK